MFLLKPVASLARTLVMSISVMAIILMTSQHASALSQTYNFTFIGNSGIDASGTITIDTVANAATSGSINVVNVPLEAPTHTPLTTAVGYLLPANGPTDVRNFDGDVLTYDTFANPSSNPIFDTSYGVAFGSSIINGNTVSTPATYDGGTPVYDTIIGLWGISPSQYGMFIGEANPADLNPDGTLIGGRDAQWVYVYTEVGSLNLTSVPEPMTNALILVALTLGYVVIRRRATA